MRGIRHRLPPLVALRAFEAAARHLSFTRAAQELGVTHGAISHQVRGLEAYLGFALFRRLPRRLVLTEAGEALFTQVRTAFDLLEMTIVQVMAAYTKRPLVVSCIATFSMRWLMPRLHQFKARYPDIDSTSAHRIHLSNSRAMISVYPSGLAALIGLRTSCRKHFLTRSADRCAALIWCNAAPSYTPRIYAITLCCTPTPANMPGMTGCVLQAGSQIMRT